MLMVQKSGEPVEVGVVYAIIYEVLYIPCGCLGFLNHQQYLVWKFPASPTLIVASQAQVARSSVQANHNSMTLYDSMPIKGEKNYTHWEI